MVTVVILGAMPQEVEAYRNHVNDGKWNGVTVHIAYTGVGKVSAAATVQHLIDKRKPNAVIFTGLAGALEESLSVGDIGIGITAVDAEMDVRKWDAAYKRGQIPFVPEGKANRIFHSSPALTRYAFESDIPRLFKAYIATGSQFLDSAAKHQFNQTSHELEGGDVPRPNIYDMETAAILQVTNHSEVPALAIRTVSDALNGNAQGEFDAMLESRIASSVAIVQQVLRYL